MYTTVTSFAEQKGGMIAVLLQ